MKKAVHFVIASCLVSAFGFVPASFNCPSHGSNGWVEASPSLAMISGTVKDEQGTPLAGAIVALLEPQPRGKELKSVKTDWQGQFSTGIVPGVYRLRAAADGFASILTRVKLERPVRVNYNFALKRTDTLVQKRGDSDDYRWIARSSPRHAMNLKEEKPQDEIVISRNDGEQAGALQPSFHGMAQFVAAGSSPRPGQPGQSFFGSNFAVSGSLGSNLEMALIGQRGVGQMAPQRLAAIATMRPTDRHQVTASIGYGHISIADRKMAPDLDLPAAEVDGAGITPGRGPAAPGSSQPVNSLDQLSVSAIGSWQALQPLLIIYGFDYSRFIGSATRHDDSVLPRFAVQYSPSSRLHLNAAMTPGIDQSRQSQESFETENLQAPFEASPAEIAFNGAPILDRSRRFEFGIERLLGDGSSAVEASAFYDLISGHGVGVLALPLEASPETQATFEQVAHRVTAMNGAARGMRIMFKRHLNDHVSAALGYSFGRGSRFNQAAIESSGPVDLFEGGFFQVATAKLDLDFTHETGTSVSTVIRLSPSAVIFAIDPFAGRMSVYDPNINIYVTQDLPNFGLPVRWQAIVDIRNLLDQSVGMDDGAVQLIAARTHRTVRGGLAFRW